MTDHTLTAPPSLLPLYARAALTSALHRGDTLPDSTYSLAGQTIKADHLAAYQRVCGFPVSDELPPTYLHILAFPLSVALMTERAFPFPLIGMVHLRNWISVTRPVRVGETVSFEVRAADLRPHSAGRQFDLHATATIDGEPVWRGMSTYLRPGKPPKDAPSKPKERAASEPPAGPLVEIRVPGDIGRRYAAVSGDRNPIHLHSLSARLFGFSSAIAHGMWLEARTLATLQGRLADAYEVDVAFKTPLLLPSTITVAADRTDDGWSLDVRSRSGKPHMTGTITQ